MYVQRVVFSLGNVCTRGFPSLLTREGKSRNRQENVVHHNESIFIQEIMFPSFCSFGFWFFVNRPTSWPSVGPRHGFTHTHKAYTKHTRVYIYRESDIDKKKWIEMFRKKTIETHIYKHKWQKVQCKTCLQKWVNVVIILFSRYTLSTSWCTKRDQNDDVTIVYLTHGPTSQIVWSLHNISIST